jgi:hypothetical protein
MWRLPWMPVRVAADGSGSHAVSYIAKSPPSAAVTQEDYATSAAALRAAHAQLPGIVICGKSAHVAFAPPMECSRR